jgi:hypothetical protein
LEPVAEEGEVVVVRLYGSVKGVGEHWNLVEAEPGVLAIHLRQGQEVVAMGPSSSARMAAVASLAVGGEALVLALAYWKPGLWGVMTVVKQEGAAK